MISIVLHVWGIFCNNIFVSDVWNHISETLLSSSGITYLVILYFTLSLYRYPADNYSPQLSLLMHTVHPERLEGVG